jgi:hypothetical protein
MDKKENLNREDCINNGNEEFCDRIKRTAENDVAVALQELEEAKQAMVMRKEYASRIFKFVCYWSISFGIVLLLQGFGGLCKCKFNLANNVIIILEGTTFLEVLGLMIIVLRYLFPVNKIKER